MDFFRNAGPVPLWILGILVKSTVVLTGVWLLAIVFRRASAAFRHLLWSSGILALLVLPLISIGLPWRMPVAVLPAVQTPAPAGLPVGAGMERHPAPRGQAAESSPAPPATGSPAPAGEIAPAGTQSHSWPLSLPAALTIVWLAGLLYLLGRLAVGSLGLAHVLRRAEPLDDPEWQRPLMEVSDRLGLERLPGLYRSDRLPMPYACGILRPAIVLPSNALEWDDRLRRAVLCHELAHLRRADLVVNGLARIAGALYWFHPLLWIAVRRLRIESERACDDLVLRAGTRPSDYADHLLRVVGQAARLRAPAMALPMAQRHEFEGRMLAILERDARRDPPGRRHLTAMAVLAVGAVVPLAALTPAMRQPTPESRQIAGTEVQVDSSARQLKAATIDQATAPGGGTQAPARSERPGQQESQGPASEGVVPDTTDSTVVRALIKALADPVAEVRKGAAYALGQMNAADAAEALGQRITTDKDPEVRATAAWAMGQIESRSGTAALARAVQSDSVTEVREQAAWALGQIEDPAATPALSAALKDRAASVRSQAAWALGQIEDPASVPGLTAALTDPVAEVRGQAAWALGQIEPQQAPEGLIRALADSVAEVRSQAAWALGQIEDPAAARALGAALRDVSKEVRQTALWALGRVGGDEARAELIKALEDPDPEIRAAAARAVTGSGWGASPRPRPRPMPRPN
ncbi:MAG: HEAT repeat domain-containing protein [Gemmatimonadales bacterium]